MHSGRRRWTSWEGRALAVKSKAHICLLDTMSRTVGEFFFFFLYKWISKCRLRGCRDRQPGALRQWSALRIWQSTLGPNLYAPSKAQQERQCAYAYVGVCVDTSVSFLPSNCEQHST